MAALALRSLRPLSFSRATVAAFFCGDSFPEDCPFEVNDWTISNTTSFMERDSLLLLERFGMGILLSLPMSLSLSIVTRGETCQRRHNDGAGNEPQFFAFISVISMYSILRHFQREKPGMGRYRIICSLDGKEPSFTLYGQYADPNKRLFPNEQYALVAQDYLVIRSVGMLWNLILPNFHIVPLDE